jgi:hypothetical protein
MLTGNCSSIHLPPEHVAHGHRLHTHPLPLPDCYCVNAPTAAHARDWGTSSGRLINATIVLWQNNQAGPTDPGSVATAPPSESQQAQRQANNLPGELGTKECCGKKSQAHDHHDIESNGDSSANLCITTTSSNILSTVTLDPDIQPYAESSYTHAKPRIIETQKPWPAVKVPHQILCCAIWAGGDQVTGLAGLLCNPTLCCKESRQYRALAPREQQPLSKLLLPLLAHPERNRKGVWNLDHAVLENDVCSRAPALRHKLVCGVT